MSAPWRRKGVGNNADKSGQGKGGGLAVSGNPFQNGVCKREEGIYMSFYDHLPVLKKSGQVWIGRGRGVEN